MILRSLLIVSPDSDRPLDQAAASGADGLIVDVAKAGAEALRRTAGFLGAAAPGAVFVRVGPLAALHTMAVLDALIPARPTGIALAAAEGGADVTRLSALLRPREAMAGIDDGATRVIALATDTPAGLLALASYRDASRRLMALAWDDQPLAEALGAEDTSQVALSRPHGNIGRCGGRRRGGARSAVPRQRPRRPSGRGGGGPARRLLRQARASPGPDCRHQCGVQPEGGDQ